MNHSCWRCDQLIAALKDEADLRIARELFPKEISEIIAEIHHRKHLPLESHAR